jgi:CheY-like chemotaxis protein
MTQRILLADDSVTIRKVVELTFSDEDFRITAVGDGAQALERARTERPDIVISDVSMPGLNGYELCERIKSDEALRGVPCLLLRGTFESFDEERAGACGAEGVIVKPFEAQEMIRKVKELIAASAQKTPVAAPPAVRPAAAPVPLPLPVQPPAPPRAAAAAVPAAPAAASAAAGGARPATQPPPLRAQTPPAAIRPAAPPPPPPARAPLPPPPAAPSRPLTIAPASPAPFSDEDFDIGPTAPAAPPATASDDDLWSEVNLRGGSAPIIDPAVGEDNLWGSLADTSILDEQDASAPGREPIDFRTSRASETPAAPAHVIPAAPVASPAAASPELVAPQVDRTEIERLVASRLDAAVRQALEPLLAGLARSVVEDVVWQVVPDLAESMIRAEIERITRGADSG